MELTLSTRQDEAPEIISLEQVARARVADAQRILGETGGTVIAYTSGWYALELPLAT